MKLEFLTTETFSKFQVDFEMWMLPFDSSFMKMLVHAKVGNKIIKSSQNDLCRVGIQGAKR